MSIDFSRRFVKKKEPRKWRLACQKDILAREAVRYEHVRQSRRESEKMDVHYIKLEIFIPGEYLDMLREVLAEADAGHIGNYDHALSYAPVVGTWRPLSGAKPFLGETGRVSEEEEYKVEVVVEKEKTDEVIRRVKACHPYEEPVINAIPLWRTGIDPVSEDGDVIPRMNIVLFQPEIPSNTGNIGRTCVATGSRLHLIEPLGFRLNDKLIKRAGMDYWEQLDLHRYMNWQEFLEMNPGASLYFATTKGGRTYSDMSFEPNAFLVFGRESGGIPMETLTQYGDRCMRIPMLDTIRSLNLANSVSIVLYEALRQQGFAGFKNTNEDEYPNLH